MGDSVGYGVMAGVAEVYLPAFALALGIAPVLAGLVATLPLLAGGLLQLVAPRAIARVSSLRRWIAVCMIAQALSFVPLIVVALAGGPATPVVFASACVYWAAGMASAAGWTPWMSRVVPARIRSKFFGRRQGVMQTSMLAGLIGAGTALHAFDGSGHVRAVYAAMFAIAMVARLGSAVMISRQGRQIPHAPLPRMHLRHVPGQLRGTPRASLLGYLLAALAATAISGPFLTPYLFVHVHVTYSGFSVFTATIVVVKVAALPVFGRLMQRLGVRRVLTGCAIAIVPIPLMWIASDAFPWLLATQVYSGLAWAGFELGMLMALFDAADDAERTTMQTAFSALQALGNAGASLLGAAMLGALGGDHGAYMWLFGVSAFARIGATALLVRGLRPLVGLPFTVAARAWTVALRPWGGTIVRPIAHRLERRRVDRSNSDPD